MQSITGRNLNKVFGKTQILPQSGVGYHCVGNAKGCPNNGSGIINLPLAGHWYISNYFNNLMYFCPDL